MRVLSALRWRLNQFQWCTAKKSTSRGSFDAPGRGGAGHFGRQRCFPFSGCLALPTCGVIFNRLRVSYFIQNPKAMRLKIDRCRALPSPRPRSACAVCVRTRPAFSDSLALLRAATAESTRGIHRLSDAHLPTATGRRLIGTF
jgi:hypothetical protein